MAVNRFGIATINVGRSIERSMRKSAKSRRHYCMIENYLHNPTRHISVNVLSASCRCHLMGVNLCLGHAAAKQFAKDVFLPITGAVETTNAHFAESQRLLGKKAARD